MALEKLGRAIEYLADDFVSDKIPLSQEGRLEAIQLLMSMNRRIYFGCPEIPRLRDRVGAFLRRLFTGSSAEAR